MQFVRKFYMPDESGGGGMGPNEEDLEFARRMLGANRENKQAASELNEVYVEMRNTLRSVAELLSDSINRSTEDLDRNSQKIVQSIGKDLAKELKKSKEFTEKLVTNSSDISKNLGTAQQIENQIEAVKSRQSRIAELMEELQRERGFSLLTEKKLLEDATAEMEKQLAILNQQLQTKKQMEKMIKGFGEAFQSLGKIPFVGPFLSSLVQADKIVGAMNEKAQKGASKIKVIGAGIDQLFKNIGVGLIGGALTAGLKFIIDAVLQFNKQTYEAAKNIGLSVKEAGKLQNQFLAIAASSKNAGLMTKDLVKSYAEISEQLGFMAPSNREFAETATLIQKRIGASAEQMGALAMQAALSGKSLSKTYQTIQATRFIEGARNKIALTNRQILDGIAKVSSQVTVNFNGSVSALSAAVVRATKLGTSLDQVNKQGESLLDFESSITKEFEAQVLTGRNINLTRARDLALNNKTVELMEELNRQGVTYETFMNQNAIARRAEAEAIGLSVEDLSKKLLLEKQAKALGAEQGQSLQDRYNQLIKQGKTQEEIAAMIGKQEAADLNRASIAEKFEAALQRLKDILGSMLMGPVGGLLESFVAFVGNTEKMTKLGTFLKGIFEGIRDAIKNFPQILSAAATAAKVLAAISIARAVASIVASAAAVPVVGVAAGFLAGGAAYAWLNSLLSGGGGSPPSPPTAGTITGTTATASPTAMTAPPSTAVAAAKSTTVGTEGPRPRDKENNTYNFVALLDGEVVAKNQIKQMGKLPQKNTK